MLRCNEEADLYISVVPRVRATFLQMFENKSATEQIKCKNITNEKVGKK